MDDADGGCAPQDAVADASLSAAAAADGPGGAVERRLQAQALLDDYAPCDGADDTAAVLRALLEHLPGRGGVRMAGDIAVAAGAEGLRGLAEDVAETLILPMRAAGGQTPRAETPTPTEPRTALDRLRDEALARDGHRCVLTRNIDRASLARVPGLREEGGRRARTVCAHVVPFALVSDAVDGEVRAAGWAAARRYFPDVEETGIGRDIDGLGNAMTLVSDLGAAFGAFQVALEAVDGRPGWYRVRYYGDMRKGDHETLDIPDDDCVYLPASADAEGRPGPSATALGVHAAIAAIIDGSGLAELLGRVCEEDNVNNLNALACLRQDGGTDGRALRWWILARLYARGEGI